jgi:hypothetical protein
MVVSLYILLTVHNARYPRFFILHEKEFYDAFGSSQPTFLLPILTHGSSAPAHGTVKFRSCLPVVFLKFPCSIYCEGLVSMRVYSYRRLQDPAQEDRKGIMTTYGAAPSGSTDRENTCTERR